MKWESALEAIKPLVSNSDFAVIVSYIANRAFLENVLECNSRFGKHMILFTEFPEEFWYPYEPSYTVLSKHRLRSVDPERNLHAKIFLFGKSVGNGKYLLQCLIGSCNATVPGFCRNVEFLATTEGVLDLSELEPKPFIEIMMDKTVDLKLIDLQRLCEDTTHDQVLAPVLDLLWRLIIDSRGGDSGLESGKSRCLSDKLVKESGQLHNAIFVHTLGENSLVKAIKGAIQSVILRSKKQTSMFLVFPYHSWFGFKLIIDACKEAIGSEDKRVEIRVLTTFPPDFETKYLSNDAFTDFEILKPKDPRIRISYRFWTRFCQLKISELVGEEFKNISGVFLHGKAIVLRNDNGWAHAIIGSANLTRSAVSTEPKVNLEVAIWERDSSTAKDIWNDIAYLWNQGVEFSESMNQRLGEWQKKREENIKPSGFWIEGSDAIKQYVKTNLIKNGHRSSERIIYLDEIGKAHIRIQLSAQAPKIDLHEIKCVFLPNLDTKNRYETKITLGKSGGLIRFSCKERIPKRVFYQIIVPTKFEKEAVVRIRQKKTKGLYKLTIRSPPFNQERYKAKLLLKASGGWREYDAKPEGQGNLVAKISERPVKDVAKLRLYGNDTRERPLSWNSITFLKRRPELALEKNCVCPGAVCFILKETSDMKSAKLLPDTVDVAITPEQQDESELCPPVHVVNETSKSPYIAQYYFGFTKNPVFDSQRIGLILRFEDENSYLRSKSSLYSSVCFSPLRREQPCELDKLVKRILDFKKSFTVESYPHKDRIVNKAPICISIQAPNELRSLLKKAADSFVLAWNVSRWGKPSKRLRIAKPIGYPTVFQINPTDIVSAFPFYVDPLEFDGMLHASFSITLKSGWNIPIRNIFYYVRNSRDYIKNLFGRQKIWANTRKYIGELPILEKKLVTAFYEIISKEGYEVLSEDQLRRFLRFGLSEMPGCFGHSSVEYEGPLITRKNAYSLVTEIGDSIARQVVKAFLDDEHHPKIEYDFFINEYTRLLRPAIYRICCRSFDYERVIVFPNLLFKEFGIEF